MQIAEALLELQVKSEGFVKFCHDGGRSSAERDANALYRDGTDLFRLGF